MEAMGKIYLLLKLDLSKIYPKNGFNTADNKSGSAIYLPASSDEICTNGFIAPIKAHANPKTHIPNPTQLAASIPFAFAIIGDKLSVETEAKHTILVCDTSSVSPPNPNTNLPRSMVGKDFKVKPIEKIKWPNTTRMPKTINVVVVPYLSTKIPPINGKIEIISIAAKSASRHVKSIF
ncbi:hypothetical protein O9G_000220 [Rozella allomycis CSF55]|uniref:Uncharacterized protein n=1 Tax=Rozella allomycis (strain CSF55) TaxID=988480 RepID=A0A075ASQ2_ROZAC|nr:hypothetical protein O9G_000220 [Rozella allomycis CSF55]|eukprot:EPZ31741.1 hypothetical protein O9G_000220 [Rozella allomycis CSF55]